MSSSEGLNPYDTPASAASRFGIELAAWIAGPWAAADSTGSGWVAVPVAIVLIALPALFNVPGDKKVGGIAVPGAVRLAIEGVLLVAAIAGAWLMWPRWLAIVVSLTGLAMVVTGRDRYRWMVRQPEEPRLKR